MYDFLVVHTNCMDFASSCAELSALLGSDLVCACEDLFEAWKRDSTMSVRCVLRKKPVADEGGAAAGADPEWRVGIGMCVAMAAYQVVLFRCFADVVFVDSHAVAVAGERLFLVTVCVIANDGQQKLACSALLASEEPAAFAGLFRWLRGEAQPFVRTPFCVVADQRCGAHAGFAAVFRRVAHVACALHLCPRDEPLGGLTPDDVAALFLCESRAQLRASAKRLGLAERRAPRTAHVEALRGVAALLRRQSLVAQACFTGNNVTCSIAERVRAALLDALHSGCPNGDSPNGGGPNGAGCSMRAYLGLVRDYVVVCAHRALAPAPPLRAGTDALLEPDVLASVHPAVLRLFADTVVRHGRAIAQSPSFSTDSSSGSDNGAASSTQKPASRRASGRGRPRGRGRGGGHGRGRVPAPPEPSPEGVRSFAVKTSADADQAIVRWCPGRRRFHCSCSFSLRTGLPCVHVVIIACSLGLRIPLSAFSSRFLLDDSIPGLVATRNILIATTPPS